jgi:hypothetical protein
MHFSCVQEYLSNKYLSIQYIFWVEGGSNDEQRSKYVSVLINVLSLNLQEIPEQHFCHEKYSKNFTV